MTSLVVNTYETIAATIVRRWLTFRYQILSRRYGRLVLEEIDKVPLLVLPDVFNPVLLRTGAFMARAIKEISLNNDPANWSQLSFLDLGTGSGVGAVFAAQQGATVTAIDINPEAVRCAQLNSMLNHLEDQIVVYQGDLFEPVQDQQFDVISFNPPFYRGKPSHNLDYAWRGVDIFERFATQLARMLTPNGVALLTLSSDGDCEELLDLLRDNNFTITIVVQKNFINERVTMYRVAPHAHN
ncbi:MAG: HemK2/MTQ2 family protein methyltransferase [Chloroflexota bacterium]